MLTVLGNGAEDLTKCSFSWAEGYMASFSDSTVSPSASPTDNARFLSLLFLVLTLQFCVLLGYAFCHVCDVRSSCGNEDSKENHFRLPANSSNVVFNCFSQTSKKHIVMLYE